MVVVGCDGLWAAETCAAGPPGSGEKMWQR